MSVAVYNYKRLMQQQQDDEVEKVTSHGGHRNKTLVAKTIAKMLDVPLAMMAY
jgi:ATP-dependent Clp protease ATP-binding subunit ClpX